MTDEPLVPHKAYEFRWSLINKQMENGCISLTSSGKEVHCHPITPHGVHPLPTMNAADPVGKQLAIEWNDVPPLFD